MTVFFYDDRPCGSGKSYQECRNIVGEIGLYLYVVEKREALAQRVSVFATLRDTAQTCPKIEVIHSVGLNCDEDEVIRGYEGSFNVRADVEALPRRFPGGHVIVIITHEALKMTDLSGFEDWTVVIDETPSIWDKQSLCTTVTRQFFKSRYHLEPITRSSSQIMLVATGDENALPGLSGDPAASIKAYAQDDLGKAVSVFHARVANPRIEVVTRTMRWDELEKNPKWQWWSIWSPEQLTMFERVTVLASQFTRSVTYRIFRERWPEIEWARIDRPTERTFAQRLVRIHYYAIAHNASRGLFERREGRDFVKKMAADITERVGNDADGHIWMCNSREEALLAPRAKKPLMPGHMLTPRQQGSNLWGHCTHVSAIFTAKADPADRVALEALNIDPHIVTESREYEVIIQFVCRTAIRVAESSETVDVYLYDERQAEAVRDYLDTTGYCTTEMIPIDLGFAGHIHDGKSGVKKKARSSAEEAERAERTTTQARERKRRQRERQRLAPSNNL